MASPVGGRFTFTDPVHLARSTKLTASVKGAQNIEVFVGKAGKLSKGYTQEIVVSDTVKGDQGPLLFGAGITQTLTGRNLTLFGGTYKVTDNQTLAGQAAKITAGFGNQTIVGAAHDTLLGGSGTQRLDGSKGSELIVGGTKTYSVIGGAGDRISGSTGATSVTAGHIVGTAGKMRIQIGSAGKYSVTAGTGDSISSAAGKGNATITGVHNDSINLAGNKGTVSILGTGGSTIAGGNGNETIKGGGGDRMGVGIGSVASVGGNLHFARTGTSKFGMHFGTNDTVHSTKYNTKTYIATRETSVKGTSATHVTVTGFKLGTDLLFYKGETSTLNKDIVLTAHNVKGGTQITLPDGTVMTILGVSSTQSITQNNSTLHPLFKL